MQSNKRKPKPKAYIFVCQGEECSKHGDRRSVKVAIKQAFSDRPELGRVKVSLSSCLGLCESAPNIIVCSHYNHIPDFTFGKIKDIIETVKESEE